MRRKPHGWTCEGAPLPRFRINSRKSRSTPTGPSASGTPRPDPANGMAAGRSPGLRLGRSLRVACLLTAIHLRPRNGLRRAFPIRRLAPAATDAERRATAFESVTMMAKRARRSQLRGQPRIFTAFPLQAAKTDPLPPSPSQWGRTDRKVQANAPEKKAQVTCSLCKDKFVRPDGKGPGAPGNPGHPVSKLRKKGRDQKLMA